LNVVLSPEWQVRDDCVQLVRAERKAARVELQEVGAAIRPRQMECRRVTVSSNGERSRRDRFEDDRAGAACGVGDGSSPVGDVDHRGGHSRPQRSRTVCRTRRLITTSDAGQPDAEPEMVPDLDRPQLDRWTAVPNGCREQPMLDLVSERGPLEVPFGRHARDDSDGSSGGNEALSAEASHRFFHAAKVDLCDRRPGGSLDRDDAEVGEDILGRSELADRGPRLG
jgi:hypothetical protein